jgi:hypothetical protein
MFRSFFAKLPTFLQRARAFALSVIKAINVFIQVCDFAGEVLHREGPAPTLAAAAV